MSLTWTRDAHGYIARFGEERQGEARVVPWRGSWVWIVDVLPGTDEALITAGRVFAGVDEAKRMAECQVAEWPTPIEGARRL